MARTITASELNTGDTFKYGYHTYTALNVRQDTEGNIWVRTVGSPYEMGFFNDSPVELLTAAPVRPAEPEHYAASRAKAREYKKEYLRLLEAQMLRWEGQAMIVFDRTDAEGRVRRVHQEYSIRRNFLAALIRMHNDPARYDIVAVEEGTWVPRGYFG